MNECKYCYMEENGDIPFDREDCFFIEDLSQKCAYMPRLSLQLTGSRRKGKGVFVLGLWVNSPGHQYSEDVYNEALDFKYCPMCGRRLEGSDEGTAEHL